MKFPIPYAIYRKLKIVICSVQSSNKLPWYSNHLPPV